jgi:hypothetical protein
MARSVGQRRQEPSTARWTTTGTAPLTRGRGTERTWTLLVTVLCLSPSEERTGRAFWAEASSGVQPVWRGSNYDSPRSCSLTDAFSGRWAERSFVPDATERAPVRNNKSWASARVTLPEALLVIAALMSANVLWIKGFDIDSAIVKCGAAVTVLTLAITAPYRILDIVRLRIIREIVGSPDVDKFL